MPRTCHWLGPQPKAGDLGAHPRVLATCGEQRIPAAPRQPCGCCHGWCCVLDAASAVPVCFFQILLPHRCLYGIDSNISKVQPCEQGGGDVLDHRHTLEDINWEFIAKLQGTRTHLQCQDRWYRRLAPGMIERGVWGDGDDRRLLGGLLRAGAAQVFTPAKYLLMNCPHELVLTLWCCHFDVTSTRPKFCQPASMLDTCSRVVH